MCPDGLPSSRKRVDSGQVASYLRTIGHRHGRRYASINWAENFMVMLQGSGQLKEMQDKWLSGGSWIDEFP